MGAKFLLVAFLIASVAGGFLLAGVASGQSSFKISGYILDSNGHGIGGANIIFNVPSIVPSVYSDSSGHYVISAPAGTYHVNVWPPFDSNFIFFDQSALTVASDITKNITLTSGYKVSGYIRDSSGAPMVKARLALSNYVVGWYSNYSGYYFLTAPAGTYTLSARPATGPQDVTDFPPYYEYNFAVNSNTIKNITVGTASTSDRTKISGYILDSNGKGLAGAEIIFGVPDIVPSVYTNNSGYYAIYAPQGTYNVNVWPPFDSNYLSYSQAGFSVGSTDIIKNVTLTSAFKLSGYLTDSSGAPIRGALASLNQFHCGWYSNSSGYYFVTAPAGTYKLMIQPKKGPTFPVYTENNFAITGDTLRNFTLTTSGITPIPNSNPEPTSTLTSTLISITAEATTLQVGSTVNVNGRLTDQNGNALADKTVTLSYCLKSGSSWSQVGSGKTDASGEYSIQWVAGASGTFILRAEWAGDTRYSGASNSTTLSFVPYQNEQVFSVESNSTVTALAFNSTTLELSFTVEGVNGTSGYVKTTIAKTLIANPKDIKVYVDGEQSDYTVSSTSNSWILTFSYHHSEHQVTIELVSKESAETVILGAPYWAWVLVSTLVAIPVAAFVVLRRKRNRKTAPPTS